MKTLSCHTGEWRLACSQKPSPNLQAWNQADHYLLNELQQSGYSGRKLAIINDEFGALALACSSFQPSLYSDSAIYRHWLAENCRFNALDTLAVMEISALAQCDAEVALLRLPKNLHFFRYQLALLSNIPGLTLYVAGMQKHWPTSFFDAASDFFADVEVLPGIKKAKCMCLRKGRSKAVEQAVVKLDLDTFGITLLNYPNVFAREQLDIGSRFLLEQMPDLASCGTVLDLACGNGVLGIYAKQQNPQLQVHFLDESAFAIRSARESWALNHPAAIDDARFYHADALENLSLPAVDAVLCNPPFHLQHKVTDELAAGMIRQSQRYLNQGGSLFLVGNRHLPYQHLLKRFFGNARLVAQNNKFKIFQSVKR